MIRYSDNPSLKLNIVTTINGKQEYRRNCKFINGAYYVKDEDCFEVGDKWVRKDSGLIIYDNETKKWVMKRGSKLTNGIIGFSDAGVPVMGVFSPNKYNNVEVRTRDNRIMCIDASIIPPSHYVECMFTGRWYSTSVLSSSDIKKLSSIRNDTNFTNRGYNIEDNGDFDAKMQSFKEYSPHISKSCQELAKLLGDTTFGAEIEIARGTMPEHLLWRTGMVVCRDGSIGGGPELVTVPMSGAKGLNNFKLISQHLDKRGDIDINCSFHLHLGNIPTSKLFLASIFVLALQIQDELFEMFPYYKTDPRGVKKKNYNQKMKRLGIHPLVDESKEGYDSFLEDFYLRIFRMLTEGAADEERTPGAAFNRKTREHPIRQKWNRLGRYYWMNLLNMIFSTRETAEFRLHQGTTNFQKMTNWLFICNAIVKYADKHGRDLIKGSKVKLKDVFNYYADEFPSNTKAKFLSEYLYAYYEERKTYFKKDRERGDRVSEGDLEADKKYKFTYKGVSDLF